MRDLDSRSASVVSFLEQNVGHQEGAGVGTPSGKGGEDIPAGVVHDDYMNTR